MNIKYYIGLVVWGIGVIFISKYSISVAIGVMLMIMGYYSLTHSNE